MNEEANTGIEQIVVATDRGRSNAASICQSPAAQNYASSGIMRGNPINEQRYHHTASVAGEYLPWTGDVDGKNWEVKDFLH